MKNWIIVFVIICSCQSSEKKQIVERFPDGSVKKIVYDRGDKEQMVVEFWQNGQKKDQTEFLGTLENGESLSWDSNGNLLFKSNFLEGKLHGNNYEYAPDGKILKELKYEKGENLVYRKYHPNGNINYELNGEKDMLYTWYESGQKKSEVPSKSGELVSYHLNGKKEEMGYIVKGLRDSTWSYWDSTGTLIKEVIYEEGIAVDSTIFEKGL